MKLVVSWNDQMDVVKVVNWGRSVINDEWFNIPFKSRLVVFANDPSSVLNDLRLGRSIHENNINKNLLDRVRLVVV